MSWKQGITWTKTHWADNTNPDGTTVRLRVQGGPFLWYQFNISETRYLEIYAGFRPTPTWGIGYGNEGDGWLFTKIGQFMKRIGCGNLGFAFRLKKRQKISP